MKDMPRICCAQLALLIVLFCSRLCAEEKVLRLYDGVAPGSESWKHHEKELYLDLLQNQVVCNVVDPTLTVIQPNAAQAVGTAVVICPGGGFHFLLVEGSEGVEAARLLASKGVTSFVLKYRLVECKTDSPMAEMVGHMLIYNKAVAPVVELAAADALAAVGYVRQHSAEYGVKPDRIGIMGFSAGGTIAALAGHNYAAHTRPNFVAPIYPAWANQGVPVPNDAPPMFLMAATDDPLGLAPHSVALYREWTAAKKPAELHLFSNGGHGFGVHKQGLPCDHWIDLFTEWLDVQGLLKK